MSHATKALADPHVLVPDATTTAQAYQTKCHPRITDQYRPQTDIVSPG